MTVDLNPIVLPVGPLAVRWFGLLAIGGLGVAVLLSLRALKQRRLGTRLALDALAWSLPVAIICARLAFVTGYWDYYLTNTSELWRLNLDGLSLWGGLLAGLAVAAARLRADPGKRRRVLDAVAPNIAFGSALGGIGAFLDGHGQGLPAQLPWATQYASPLSATPDFGVPRHPVQLYGALAALLIGMLLLALPRTLPAGTRLATFLTLYGCARLALGAITLEPAFLGGLQMDQLLAIIGVATGIIYAARPLLGARRMSTQPWPMARHPEAATAEAPHAEEHPLPA